MPLELFANSAQTTLSGSITNSAATLAVASSAGFPAPSTTSEPARQFRVRIDNELLIVTAVSGTTWTVTRGAEGTSAASHTSGATVTLVVSAKPLNDWSLGSYYDISVLHYGATGDGSTDDTSAFTAAITAGAAASITGRASRVYVPSGIYVIGPIVLQHRMVLIGAGVGATTLKRKTGTSGPLVSNAAHAHMCQVSDLRIDGAYLGTTTEHGLKLDNSATYDAGLDEYVDGRHVVSNLVIQGTKGDGFVFTGRGVVQAANVQVWDPDGNGFNLSGPDSFFTNCDSGGAGLDGFLITAGSHRFTGCKSWFSGTVSTAGGVGNGWHIKDNYEGGTFTSCGAQDNGRAGFFLDNAGRQTLAGCEADSNNTAGGGYAGFDLSVCWTSSISGTSWDRNANTNKQAAALHYTAGGGFNRVALVKDSSTSMPNLTAASVLDATSLISFDGATRLIIPDTQSGTAYTLVLSDAGKLIETTNAGAVTVTVPPNSSAAFSLGTVIQLTRMGAGSLTLAAGAGVTLRSPGTLAARAQYSTISLRKRATDEWVLDGDVG